MDWRVALRIGALVVVIGIPVTIYWAPYTAAFIVGIVEALAPLWLPVLLLAIAWPLWLTYVRSQYVSAIQYATLELKPGDNTPKSAQPMELVFYSLYHRTEVTLISSMLMGMVRVPWSFEIAASNGVVRFFMHIPVHHRAAVEGRLRAEYRDIDIDEVRDYSREDHFDPINDRLTMREYTLSKADPYPLRTYTSHEHEKEKHDIFSEMLEGLATVGEGEHVWMQFMIRPHQRDWGRGYFDFLNTQTDTLHDDARTVIQKLVGSSGDVRGLPANKQATIKAIEEALQKPSFDCGLRVVYMAERSRWSDERAESLDTLFERFDDPDLNGFESYDPRANVGWPLTDVFAALPALDMEYFLKLYRRRAFFAPPYYGRAFVLNAEEMATVYHIPKLGRASALSRARGKRLEPPDNLPV